MRLASIHFEGLTPIPGTSRRETALFASDGWELTRQDDGRIRCARDEDVDGGGTVRRSFVLERWPVAYVPETPVVDEAAFGRFVGRLEPAAPAATIGPDVIDASLAEAPTEPPPEPPTKTRRKRGGK